MLKSYVCRQMICQQHGQGAQIRCDFQSDLEGDSITIPWWDLRFQPFPHLPR